MTVRLSVTQCTIPCTKSFGRRGKLVLRLTTSDLSADNKFFLPIDVETVTNNLNTGKSTYVFTYDENLLADPGHELTAEDFTLVCVDVGDEYAIEQAEGAAGLVNSVNGKVGTVVLDADDIDDSTTANKFIKIITGYSVSNFTETRTIDLATATPNDVANFVCTVVNDLMNGRRPNA